LARARRGRENVTRHSQKTLILHDLTEGRVSSDKKGGRRTFHKNRKENIRAKGVAKVAKGRIVHTGFFPWGCHQMVGKGAARQKIALGRKSISKGILQKRRAPAKNRYRHHNNGNRRERYPGAERVTIKAM